MRKIYIPMKMVINKNGENLKCKLYRYILIQSEITLHISWKISIYLEEGNDLAID